MPADPQRTSPAAHDQTTIHMVPCRTADGSHPGIRFRSAVNPRTGLPGGMGYRDERGELVRYHCHGEQDADDTFVFRPHASEWSSCPECNPDAPVARGAEAREAANIRRRVARWTNRALVAEARFDRAMRDGDWTIEVEDGAACIAYRRGLRVTNGQSSVEDCFDVAYETVWGPDGTMRRAWEEQWYDRAPQQHPLRRVVESSEDRAGWATDRLECGHVASIRYLRNDPTAERRRCYHPACTVRTGDADARARMQAALRDAARTFDAYADLHAAKGTDDGARKAAINREHAATCRAAIAGTPIGVARAQEEA